MRQDNKSVGSPPPVFTLESQDASQCREADEGCREVDRACAREKPQSSLPFWAASRRTWRARDRTSSKAMGYHVVSLARALEGL